MRANIFKGLKKTREFITQRLRGLSPEEKEEVEEILIQTDMDISTVEEILARITKKRYPSWKEGIKSELLSLFPSLDRKPLISPIPPTVILIIGVNGVGKTTTVGKLAHKFLKEGKKVLLSASDTFRAAAIEQLLIIGEKAGADVIKQSYGADPAAVTFDALQAAIARGYHYLIVDTAGRMHSDRNLLEELKKIKRVLNTRFKYSPFPPPQEILLVLDANIGKNSLQQAKIFHSALGITGIVLAKLDSSAKGGIVLSIERELGVPVKWVGVGEGMEDLIPFSPEEFVKALLD